MTIFKFELDKIIKNKAFIGAWIVMLMSIFALAYAAFLNPQLNMQQSVKEANEYAGELTDQNIRLILSDYLRDMQNDKDSEQALNMFHLGVVDTFVLKNENIFLRVDSAKNKGETFTVDDLSIKSVKDLGFTEFDKPLKVGNYLSWFTLFEVMSWLFILMVLVVILFCSLLFANDTAKNIVPLLFSTKFGRTKMITSKLWVGTLLTIVTFTVVHGLLIALYGICFGFSGWDVSIQANFMWQIFDFPLGWNNLQVFFFSLGFQLAGIVFIAGLTMFVSSILRSPFTALAVSLGLFFLPQGLTRVFTTGVANKLLYLFPVNTFETNKFFSLMNQNHSMFVNSFMGNVILIIAIMLVGKIIFDVIIHFRMKTLSFN